jgi:RNA polymerase sigma factor (sigma-70 family)
MPDPMAEDLGRERTVSERLLEALPLLHALIARRASRRLLDRETADDLVQSVCREALEAAASPLGGDAGFRRWLSALAIRKLVDRQRAADARKRQPPPETPRQAVEPGPDAGVDDSALADPRVMSPSRDAALREELQRLERALARLSDDHRDVIAFARILELPHAEVARRMGRSEPAVRQLLARALVQLGVRLADLREGSGAPPLTAPTT